MAKKASKQKNYTFIDLFAGIGGFHQAMHSVGTKCVFASEWDKNARISYIENYKNISPELFENDCEFFNHDITQQEPSKIPAFDVCCAGFPCQPFSIAGLRNGLCHGWFGERDYDTATKIYRKLARKGDPDAMNNYAFSYLLGTGVKKNLRLAEFWMWKAIWKGNIHAAANYAQLVLENTFNKISKSLGMWLCFWAADCGEPTAMNDLGLSYETGILVKKDLKKAYEWFMKSVEHGGGACAEFNVSRCYRFGLGVEEDERKADAWQNLAIEHGFDIEAYNNLYDLG